MQSLADVWVRSGKISRCLYSGSKEEIITELKSWVERRKTFNNAKVAESWDVFRAADLQQQIETLHESNQGKEDQAIFDQVSDLTAIQMRNFIHLRNLEKEQHRENLLADFFLSSLRHRGVRWPPVLCGEDRRADASVCACLGVVDQGFDAKTEQEILEDKARGIQWFKELKRRNEPTGAHDIVKDPVRGVYSYLTGIYTSDLLDNTDMAADETNPGTENHVAYIADTLGNITIATRTPSSVAADTPNILDNAATSLSKPSNDTQDVAGPSSSTVTKTGVESQDTLETEGGDEVVKMSKAKKKREQKKRAKARAKEAAANAEDIVGNNDDDENDRDVPTLVPL